MYLFLIAFLICMICYLVHEISSARARALFNETLKSIEQEKKAMADEIQSLKAKEEFYSQLLSQLEREGEKVATLSAELAKLKAEIKAK